MAHELFVHVFPRCDPADVAVVGEAILGCVGEPDAPARLAVFELSGENVVLGRHQRAASAIHLERCARPPVRRAGGGRAIFAGEGTLAVLLAVPAGGTFLTASVGADKVLNRYLRGIMAGLGAHYFGRDYLSADRRQLANVSQESTRSGAHLVEVIVGVTRSLDLPAGLHAYPPHPDSRAAGPPAVTLAELMDPLPGVDELVDRMIAGHARLYGCAPERRDVDVHLSAALERERARGHPPAIEEESGLARGGPLPVPIGFVEALVRLEGGFIAEARVRGDFIAPAFAVDQLEAELVGRAPTSSEVGRRVDAAFRPPATIIGVTDLGLLARAILERRTV